MFLEYPHQQMQNFCKFAHLKSTFSILHSFVQNIYISLFIIHIYSNKYSSTPTINPPSHYHQPTNLQLIHSYQTHKQSPKKTHTHTHKRLAELPRQKESKRNLGREGVDGSHGATPSNLLGLGLGGWVSWVIELFFFLNSSQVWVIWSLSF